ncbi:OLC1v1034803C1 [Oldenlandia corymbosa var. corymbosa]|uniref:OLC1v1034803C1 n=1 Tax=Oldenlandia corymbosa var. corymbosa TaxID=529605 RepID=A0AAV1CRE5_OLDCO|nr:OLC1v1034803C1 [Oldenlandia corymbosa var. corymbosa]
MVNSTNNFNTSSIKTSSGGAWQGDNPLQFAFPLLVVQTTVVLLISRLLFFLLKPLRQPKVVAEILGGILLGPSALGRNEQFMRWIFPKWSNPILESVASIGLLFFMFLVGLELDLAAIRRSGRKAFGIAAASILLPFLCSAAISFFLIRKAVEGGDHHHHKVGYIQFLTFIGVSLSITAFPVLARILAELRLLTTEVGQTAMAAAAFNDVAAWILLALAVALAGGAKSPLISIWVLLSGAAFVAFMLVVVRRVMKYLLTAGGEAVLDEAYICLTLAAVMVSGFVTDLIGIHSIFGAFIFGLTIPKDGDFAANLTKRIEDFVSGLLLPLYFASSGLKTDVTTLHGLEAWGILALVISTACAGKILGTFFAAMMCMIDVRESLTLGVLMNTKGLVELIVLNIGREKEVLNDEMFAILVIMALFTTFMTTPIAVAIYKPTRKFSSDHKLEESSTIAAESSAKELRLLMCIRGPEDSSSLVNLIELCRSTQLSQLKLYAMQLLELTERSSSILMVQRARKNGVSCIRRCNSRGESSDIIAASFKSHSHLSKVKVRPTTSISALSTMHEDICHVAERKRAAMIILPFHKAWRRIDGDQEKEMNFGHSWREVNRRVLMNATCPVGMLVDCGFGVAGQQNSGDNAVAKRVCIIFLGGSDSRKALQLGVRMAEHPAVRVTVFRFKSFTDTDEAAESHATKEMDNTALAEFRRNWKGEAEYIEKETGNLTKEVMAIRQRGEFELIIVGRGRFSPEVTAHLADRRVEFDELGHIGDLISSGEGIRCSLLVIQESDTVIGDGKNPKFQNEQL